MASKKVTSTASTKRQERDTKRITQAEIPKDLQNRVREKLVTARVTLLMHKPFFGNLATRLQLVAADDWCPTAATDGRHFYYNHAFVDSLRPKEVEFLFGHEVMHVVYDHMGRRGDRDAQLYNIAADYVVNLDLVDQKVGELITTVPALYDVKYRNMTSEDVYDLLYNNATKINISDLLDQLLDDHLDDDGGDESQDGEDGEGGSGKGRRPKLTDDEKKAIRDEVRNAVLNAAQQCQAGDLPAGIRRMITSLTEPKMNWREMLRMNLISTMNADYSWLVVSRRGWDLDAVLPGMVPDEQIDICAAIDVSGSISEKQARDFLSEIKGIMGQFNSYRIHVWCFDTQVYNPQVYTSDNLENIDEYEILGGGGTSFQANWDWMKQNDVQPKKFVMFTDLYCHEFGDPDYCDTLWVIHSNPQGVAPHGVSVQYDEHA